MEIIIVIKQREVLKITKSGLLPAKIGRIIKVLLLHYSHPVIPGRLLASRACFRLAGIKQYEIFRTLAKYYLSICLSPRFIESNFNSLGMKFKTIGASKKARMTVNSPHYSFKFNVAHRGSYRRIEKREQIKID